MRSFWDDVPVFGVVGMDGAAGRAAAHAFLAADAEVELVVGFLPLVGAAEPFGFRLRIGEGVEHFRWRGFEGRVRSRTWRG